MSFKNIVVAGGGVLGSQIAFQAAYKGFQVTMWLRSEGSIQRAKPKIERLYRVYLNEIENLKKAVDDPTIQVPRGLLNPEHELNLSEIKRLEDKVHHAFSNLQLELDLKTAVQDADLLIESVSERPQDKTAFYQMLAPLLPEKTLVVTNTSTLVPSMFAEATGRPEKYLALHFANNIWRNNTAEVMGHQATSKAAFDAVVLFAKELGMIPLELKKEQPGYLLNSLLVPFLSAAEALLVNEVADHETIDKAWILGTGAPLGPFRILDIVGLETAYNIVAMRAKIKDDPASIEARIAAMLKAYIDEGRTGLQAGRGFYDYSK